MSTAEPESPVLKTPEWLEVLENKRKRPHKLAHEIGAGAPCTVCKDGCKGLNLHFWRKLCIECKCRKEDHEVNEEEDYAQFEILFGAKKVKRTTLKFNAQNKSFDWIPPNVTPELAVDYLKSIPQSKLPISNSEGARYRKQQLEKQLPLHDVDPNACHDLSDKEMKEFEKYLDNLKNNVIGQGKIMKFKSPAMLKENCIRDPSLNMTASSEDYSVRPQGVEIRGHLTSDKVPGYNISSHPLNSESYPVDNLLNVKLYKYSQPITSNVNLEPLRSLPLERNEKIKQNSHLSNQTDVNFKSPRPYFPSNLHRETTRGEFFEGGNEQKNNLGLRTPSSFMKKAQPANDRQNNNAEIPQQDDNCNEKFNSTVGQTETESSCQQRENSGAFNSLYQKDDVNLNSNPVPYDESVCKVPLTEFNQLSVSSSEVPFSAVQETGKIGVPNRFDSRLRDSSKDVNHSHSQLVEEPSYSFPTPPSTCQQCLEILNPDDVVVQTERAGNLALWHAKCFVCETCKELLVDLMYFFNKGKVYCGRHYAEMMKIPRCFACDELIFVKEYTCAEGESYHVRHFCCFHCDQPLGGKQYIPKDNQPVCLDCFQIKYGKTCRTCQKAITAGEQRVSWKDLDFHVYPQCFRCAKCLKSLLGGKFMVKNLNTFCSKECVQEFSQ